MRIAQDQRFMGDDWWEWSVWIDAPKRELERIEDVTWHLHPTFDPKEVLREDPETKFALETAGWGTFRVRASVRLKSGKVEKLTHELELDYPDGSPAPA